MAHRETTYYCPKCRTDAVNPLMKEDNFANYFRALGGAVQIRGVNCPDCSTIVSYPEDWIHSQSKVVAVVLSLVVAAVAIGLGVLTGAIRKHLPGDADSAAALPLILISSIVWLPITGAVVAALFDKAGHQAAVRKSRLRLVPLSARGKLNQKKEAKDRQTIGFLNQMRDQEIKPPTAAPTAPQQLLVYCPQCRRPVTVLPQYAGMIISCPYAGCGGSMTTPSGTY